MTLSTIDPQERPELIVADEEVTAFVALHATRSIQRQYDGGDEPASIVVQLQGATIRAYDPEYVGNDLIIVTLILNSGNLEYIFALQRTENDSARWEVAGNILIDVDPDQTMKPGAEQALRLAHVVNMILA